MEKTALVIASDGTEEVELVVTSNVLRRCGVKVTIAGLQEQRSITCAKETSLNVDFLLREVLEKIFDVVVLPGGLQASENLSSDLRVGELLRRYEKEGRLLAAICAAPLAFKSHNIGKGGTITSHLHIKDDLIKAGYHYSSERVCVWKNLITSQGPGTAFEFAFKIVECLGEIDKAKSVREGLLIPE